MDNFTFKHVRGPFGDCTSIYDVILNKEYTVKEFINDMLKALPGEWGAFIIRAKDYPFGKEQSEYRYGKLLTTFSEETLNSKIKCIEAQGGWSLMDYNITLRED